MEIETAVANLLTTALVSVLLSFFIWGMFRRVLEIFLRRQPNQSKRRVFSRWFMLFWLALWLLLYLAEYSDIEEIKIGVGIILSFIYLLGFTLYAIANVVEFIRKKRRGEKQSMLRWVLTVLYFLFAFCIIALLIGVCCRICIDLLLP